MVRDATVEDVTGILKLGAELKDDSPSYRHMDIDPLKARKTLAFLVAAKKGFLAVEERDGKVVGFLAGQVDDLWWSTDWFATDLMFLVHPDHAGCGSVLMDKFLAWAKTFPKVKDITMAVSSGMGDVERTGKLYESKGLSHVGGMYSEQVGVNDE